MASTIKIKNSSTAGAAPTASDLVQGELAVNVTDKRIYTENASGTVVELGTNPSVPVTFPDGSASAPSLTNDGDTNTGVFFPAADAVGVTTGGTERVRVDSSGNVGIGTSSPSALGLQVTKGSGVSAGLLLSNANNNWSVSCGASTNALIFTDNQFAERARIDSSGNLLVGTTSSVLSGKLTVKGTNATISSDGLSTSAQLNIQAHNGAGYDPKIYLECPGVQGAGMYLNRATGQLRLWSTSDAAGVSLAGGGTSWGSFSDERLKDIIEPIENAAEKVCSLRAVIGKYKTDVDNKRRVFLIAQDVRAVLPEAVYQNSDEDDTLSLAYTDTIPLLVAAIQELKAIVDAQAVEIAALKGQA